MAAAKVDPEIGPYVGPYASMSALPSILDAVQSRAKDVYASGWRPPVPPGPTGSQLAEIMRKRWKLAHPERDCQLASLWSEEPRLQLIHFSVQLRRLCQCLW
jgi:hypothetical protein